MSHSQNYDKTNINERREIRFYRVLALISVVIMVTAAYMTYGQQKREILIAPQMDERSVAAKSQHIQINADLSSVPSDKDLKKILNGVMPNICKDCDDSHKHPLNCLDRYTMNKIVMTGTQGETILSAEILTGKVPKKYFVMIDLSHNNVIIKKGGEIDKKECLETPKDEESTDSGTEIYIDNGDDPIQSNQVIVN